MSDFKDVKIVKKCEEKQELSEEVAAKDCEEFEFGNEHFLKSIDNEILYIDDSIPFQVEPEDEEFSIECPINTQVPRDSPPICFDNVPKKLTHQISLPIENIKDLSFYESFIISQQNNETAIDIETDTDNSNEIGSACVMVEELSDGNILIFTIQQIFVNNERIVCESLSVVTKDLRLIHEKRIERKCSDDKLTEKAIFIISTDNGYRLTKSVSKNEDTEFWKADVEWTKCGDFTCYGANVLMIRKLVMENFKGCIQTYTCDIEGEFALSQFWFHGIELKTMYDHEMTIKRVDQLLIFDDKRIEKTSGFFLMQTSQMLKQVNDNRNYFIHMNPFVDPFQQKYTEHLQKNWQDDVQLMSMYLEFKAKRKEELKKKFESPQMKFLLNEYILNLIKCKPKSIMNFTVEFMKKLERNNNVNVQLQIFKTVDRRTQQN